MSGIGGERRPEGEQGQFAKRVGLFEARVIAVNPTEEQFKEILGMELKEDSKAAEYLGERDGNALLRVDFWLEEVKNKDKFKVSFFLEDKERENKDGTKQQYINELGSCSWADDPNNLPDWFVKREYRQAYVGEEDLYNFMRNWLCELDYRSDATTLQVEWKKLMKGNVKEIKDQVGGDWCGNVVCLATVIVKDVDGEMKEYQGIYNKAFLPAYSLKNFRLIDYSNPKLIAELHAKKPKDLKIHEKFVVNVTGEYGCKNIFVLKDLQEYNSEDHLEASDKTISNEGDDY